MSQSSPEYNPAPREHHRAPQGPLGGYIPTEDEKRVMQECNRESFWYRSLPFSAVAIAVTQVMVTRGVLTPSPRFGSMPKVAFAGLCGFLGGKVSYMKVCQEKFKKLENSPLGEALRQGRLRNMPHEMNRSEYAEASPGSSQQPDNEATLQPTVEFGSRLDSYGSYSSDYSSTSPSYDPASFSSGMSEPIYSTRDDNIPQASPYQDEETPKKKSVLYEELRSKNRENYEVTLTQKAETSLKPQAEVTVPKKEVKKNKYGDAWEE